MPSLLPRLLVLAFAIPLASAADLRLVPTFENGSVYVENAGVEASTLSVRYRAEGEAAWTAAHALVASANDAEPRGSLFGLRPGTTYTVECLDSGAQVIASGTMRTWSDDVPIARTVRLEDLAPGGGPVLIDQGGTAEGWVRYVADGTIQGGDRDAEAILVEGASYVLIDGVTVRGGRRHGIRVQGAEHVRIRGCDIAGFGRIGEQRLDKDGKYYEANGAVINYDAGVCIDGASRVVVESCFIHDPRGRANSWFHSHPSGPNAIWVRSGGGNVIRWNDCIGSQEHRWNDVIEGYGNGKPEGGFNCDSDIYGNYLVYGNDDGIELDGPQRNVRFYGNRVEGMLCGISTAPNLRGPSWVFANVVAHLGDERGLGSAAVKNGGGSTHSQGTTFFYHNTFLTAGHGIAGVGFGSDKDRNRFIGVSRNNVFIVGAHGVNAGNTDPRCDFDHDLFAKPDGRPGTWSIAGGDHQGKALRAPAGLADLDRGDLRPVDGSPSRGAAVPLPGFAWLQGQDRDLGAIGRDGRAVPWRPAGLASDGFLIAFRGSGPDILAQTRETVVRNTSDQAQDFRIDQTAAQDWLIVEPATGTIPAGGEVRLRLRLTEAIWTRQGSAVGAIVVRTAATSLPLSIQVEVRRHEVDLISQVEDLPGAEAFTRVEDAEAFGGAYLTFAAETPRKVGERGVDLVFTVPADGAYVLSLRLRCPEPIPEHDSIFLSLDGDEAANTPLSGNDTWGWSTCTGKNGMSLILTAGEHRLRLLPRESIDLDAVRLHAIPLGLTEVGPKP